MSRLRKQGQFNSDEGHNSNEDNDYSEEPEEPNYENENEIFHQIADECIRQPILESLGVAFEILGNMNESEKIDRAFVIIEH